MNWMTVGWGENYRPVVWQSTDSAGGWGDGVWSDLTET